MTSRRPLCIAHRGAPFYEPENTLKSFHKATLFGADAIELDVRATRDRVPIVIHDETLDRTTDGSGYVEDHTLDEIRNLIVGRDEKVPLLAEVLELSIPLVFDIKVVGIENEVLEVVRRAEAIERISICASSLSRVAPYLNQVKVGFFWHGIQSLDSLFDRGISFLAPDPSLINSQLVNQVRDKGIAIYSGTVDDPKEMTRLLDIGADGMITNRPDVLKQIIDGYL